MGTNYYLIPNHENWQVKRNKFISQVTDLVSLNSQAYNKTELLDLVNSFISETRIHLGKNSFGWNFSFNSQGFNLFHDKETFQKFIRKGVIVNEYGDKLTAEEFEKICFDFKTTNMTHTKYPELNVSVIDQMEFLDVGENFS